MEKWLAWRTRPKLAADEVPVTAQELYADWVKASLSPAFRAMGLKGSGGRYSLSCADCWVMLGLQKSTYSDAAEVRFTVNLMVANKSTWAEMRSEQTYLPEKPAPGTLYSHKVAQTRIGTLLPDGEDLWWRVYPAVDLSAVGDAVTAAVREYGMPWLRSEMSRQGCESARA